VSELDGDRIAGKDIADDASQVFVVLDHQDASFLARAAEDARQLAEQCAFIQRFGNPSLGMSDEFAGLLAVPG
jgi:hypothetical protein